MIFSRFTTPGSRPRGRASTCATTALATGLLLSLAAACSDPKDDHQLDDIHDGDAEPLPAPPALDPATGEFVSADGVAGSNSNRSGSDPAAVDEAQAGDGDGDSDRTVEEGDIYRLYGESLLLNLNPYRGLQVVSLADVAKPQVIGKLREAGYPVEMYVVGTRAVVLLNNWTGYWGSRTDVRVKQQTGGLVLNVDLSDPGSPKVVDREFVPGNISTSRLTRQGDRAALYVAASIWDCWGEDAASGDCSGTVVKSFDVSENDMVARTRIDLGGYVNAVQATPEALIVSRYDYSNGFGSSKVSLVDISNIDGQMVEGVQVTPPGNVQNKFNLDLRGGVLRIVSSGNGTNQVTTYAAPNVMSLTQVDQCAFGGGQSLYATLFMEDRAFFVTYLRQDPFHAFSIDAAGNCEERSEFVVSGWNDFFRPVFDNSRLIGIGIDDAQSTRTVAVSLYDVSDLDNATPLLARANVDAQNSSSAANWDDKAYSVIEGAVSVPAVADANVIETGLILLPFTGYDANYSTQRAAVQIYTFSEHTLSRRGVMDHGSWAERSFQAAPNLAANLSSSTLSLFNIQNPDQPEETGRLNLAPSYNEVHDYGTFFVRVRDTRQDYGWWWGSVGTEPPKAYAEVIPANVHPDEATPLASIQIPAGARTFRLNQLLVSVSTQSDWSKTPAVNTSKVQVFDLQNPAAPSEIGSLTSDRLLPARGYGFWGYGGYAECGVMEGNYYDDYSRVLSNAIVFGHNEYQQKSIGNYEFCSFYPKYTECGPDPAAFCAWDAGSKSCERQVDSNTSSCSSDFARCTRKDGDVTCATIPEAEVRLTENCYQSEKYRYWQSMKLDVLDLSTPAQPKLVTVDFDPSEESEGLVVEGSQVYFAFKKPFVVKGDSRPYVKYYYRAVDLSSPSAPVVAEPRSVPGRLRAVTGDRLFAQDLRWGAKRSETWLHALELQDQQVNIVHSQSFADRDVTKVLPDGEGNVFVSDREIWSSYAYYETGTTNRLDKLSIFDANSLTKRGETMVDNWTELTMAIEGRALFTVPGGFLVVNALDPAVPYAQAYFPNVGWLSRVSFDGSKLLLAAGPYGIHQFDATTQNLLAK